MMKGCVAKNSVQKLLFSKMSTSVTRQPRPFTVLVEGNIGSGKTTFLQHFQRSPGVLTVSEPVTAWRNAAGHNLLELMYEEPARHSMAFQSYVQLTMLQKHLASTECAVKIMERSIHSARHCFVENLHQAGFLSGADHAVLDQWYRWICSTQDVSADLIVYLHTSPETALKRVQNRARSEEKTVTLGYLEKLHDLHESWLRSSLANQICTTPVVVIDANKDLSELGDNFAECKAAILDRSTSSEDCLSSMKLSFS